MPPLNRTKADGPDTLRKDVEWVAKDDDDDQVATGIVMVPDKVDLQNDFVREEQLRAFADQFENFESVGEAGGGVMHAVWPDEHINLVRNEVLDEPQTIGGETAPAGAWIQSWEFDDDELWGLVEDGILAGYSVGIDSVRWDGPYEQEDLDDVEVPPEIEDGELVWQIVDGIMREVSAVDIPAVPDAQILDKAAVEKRLAEHLGNRDAFLEEAQQRGHSEAEAERLWEYLNDAVDIEGAGEPGEKTWFDRAKEFFSVQESSDDDAATAAKEGRTLSQANRESAMAAVDANLDILEDAGVDHGMTRFTDQDDVDFDLSEHDAREWSGDHDDKAAALQRTLAKAEGDVDDESFFETMASHLDGWDVADLQDVIDPSDYAGAIDIREYASDLADRLEITQGEVLEALAEAADVDEEELTANYAPEGETSDGTTESMSDDSDGEDKSLAEQNAEQINELTESVKELTDAITGPEPKTAEIEIDGETYEVPEQEMKAALGVDKDADSDDVADAIEALKSEVDAVDERLDTISQQSGLGGSSQIRDAASDDGDGDDSTLDTLGKALN